MALRLLIIADDLTGALDCACEASMRGIPATVFRTVSALVKADPARLPAVVAVSTGSRELAEEDAICEMEKICAVLPDLSPAHVMKKIDSRLKGHVSAESGVLLRALRLEEALCLPAIPDMGRVQIRGHIRGQGVTAAIRISDRMSDMTCLAPDIVAERDFNTALDQYSEGRLLLGARGLACALVKRLWPGLPVRPAPRLGSPALFAIGSRDPITIAQVDRLRQHVTELEWQAAPNGVLPPQPQKQYLLYVLQVTQQPKHHADARMVACSFAQAIEAALLRSPASTLFACGGEIADAVLARLNVARIDVDGAVLPGVAAGRITLPDGTSLHFLTKSGGFGDHDTLLDLARMVDKSVNSTKIAHRC
ncbi:four-carbon acid sugar kinase family protein [Roseinatronobacter sp.]|uniref:four-carbon acid sugar kinase family protein n=1 Tax=Roseinatronobacter sp. TaxID=1945755 RepID=UPI003F730306